VNHEGHELPRISHSTPCRGESRNAGEDWSTISPQLFQNPANANFWMFGQIAFPNPDDAPSGTAQGAVYHPVAGFVASCFVSEKLLSNRLIAPT